MHCLIDGTTVIKFLQTGSAIVTSLLHLQPCLEYFRHNFGVWTTRREHLGVDSSKSGEGSLRPQHTNASQIQDASRSDNICTRDAVLTNKRIAKTPNFAPFRNFVQVTSPNAYAYNQYLDSNGNQDLELYRFPKNSFSTHVSSKSNSTYTNSSNSKTLSVASSGNSSNLNQPANVYTPQQYSSTDFLSNNSNTNFNSGNTGFFSNSPDLNFNQQYCVSNLRELRSVGAKDCASSTKTTASIGTYLTPSYGSADSVLGSKCSKGSQSLHKNYKLESVRETGSSSTACASFLGDYATRWESYCTKANGNQELGKTNCQTVAKMSGGPPHHPHRQAPSPNTAWNHLQVPNYYPRQPQHAHMSNEHPLLHQPTWHTPTTEPVKSVSHSHLFNLEQMISERPYPRHSPGVDLSLQRNGSQNGELPTTPISLSVRDANKINSLPASAIDIQAVELTKSLSPGLKSASPGLKSLGPGNKPASPVLKAVTPASPGIKQSISPGISASPGIHEKQDSPKNIKRPTKRMDSIIERLNPIADKGEKNEKPIGMSVITEKPVPREQDKWQVQLQTEKHIQEQPEKEKSFQSSVIVQLSTTTSSHDENSNSSSALNAPTPTSTRDEEVTSPFSNEDSTDSSKSRRKRKPAKTIRVSKETEKIIEIENQITAIDSVKDLTVENQHVETKITPEVPTARRRSGSAPPGSPTLPPRSRRKTSSESETIANIAAMVEKTAYCKPQTETNCSSNLNTTTDEAVVESQIIESSSKPISVSVIKTKENVEDECSDAAPSKDKSVVCKNEVTVSPITIITTPAQKKLTDANSFVEVENKLEEMFAGISDDVVEPPKLEKISLDYNDDSKSLGLEESKNEDTLLKLEDNSAASTSQFNDNVTSTSNDQNLQKRGRPKGTKSRRSSESTSMEVSPKRKKGNKKAKACSEGSPGKSKTVSKKSKGKNSVTNKQIITKADIIKDVYAYDSGSNASSSKSRGPFVQIRGSRDSPISVSIVNTPTNDEDSDKKSYKSKKYHDDTEYRHKVRSRGLHCSTLSNKYDAQTRDATWICVFCKRGPHATEPHLSGPSRFNANVIIPPPGDLFGPYIITTDSPEYQRCLDDPYDLQFRSKKVARVVTAAANNKVVSKKSKRKHSDSYDSRSSLEGTDNTDIYLGITETKDKVYEVWVHEDCIVWSPGVYLVGPKIVGLEEAVWTSCNVVCSKCRYMGANLCCVKRGCINVMHFGCAAASDWYLDEENYRALCVTHKVP